MILNRQRRVAVSVVALDRFWQRARRSLGLPEDSLTVCLVSEARMTRWNRAYRGKRGPTDVLSFPASTDGHLVGSHRKRRAGTKRGLPLAAGVEAGDYLGDIAIAPAVASRNARRMGRPLDEELRILILHGALHLLGYDHETDDGQMNRIERRLRKQLGLGPS